MALLGRERELTELDARLRAHRIVTVVGPGGIGKTVLAEEAAGRAAGRFPMGTRRVDLTRIEAPEAVAGAVAAQLGFDSFEALLSSPHDRPVLLVVDNCEHLLDAAAEVVAGVLGECHLATVLATSRSPLELPGEGVVAVAPLLVPPAGHPDPRSFPSVQLFLTRARAAGASITGGDTGAVADLCRRLDGLPLAIELAAARARTLSVGDIADRLEDGVDVLERRHFRGERRHRSITDTIRWSYDLLDGPPACLLQQLAVFAGPFHVDAARAVAAAESCGDDGTFADDLEELVYASLVTADTSGPGTRYRLLDTVRRFARERLTSCGGLERTMDAFVDATLTHALASTRGGTAVWRPDMIRALLDAFDNLAEALRWCNEHDDRPDRALTLCGVLWTVVHQGRADDVVVLARQTIDRWQGTEHPRMGAALATLATAEYVTGHPWEALAIAEPAVLRVPRRGSAPVKLLRLIGQARSAVGDLERAIATFADAAALARDQGMTAMAIELDIVHAHVGAVARDDAAGAVAALEAASREAEEVGSAVTGAWARTTLGWLLLRSDPDRALGVITDALATSRALEYPIGIAGNLRSMAYGHLLRDDLPAAHEALAELLDDLLRRGALSDARLVLDATALLAQRLGHPEWEVLAATARSLPVVSLLLTLGSEPLSLPPTDVQPMARHDAVAGAKRVLDELAPSDPAEDPPPPAPAGRHRMVPIGDGWEVTFEGEVVAVRASKGMSDIARLLAAPGREIHCLDLAGAGAEETSTGEVIDVAARRRYEARIRELQEDLEDAEAGNDLARVERAQTELDALVDHLTAAMGRGGRTRHGAGSAERARSAVTQRIRGTIRRLEDVHPPLGRHLRASITTGTWCAYRPERPSEWELA